jgi:hypothetical protein
MSALFGFKLRLVERNAYAEAIEARVAFFPWGQGLSWAWKQSRRCMMR